MRHRSFITVLMLLVMLIIISCSLGARLPTPTATTPPAAPFESDSDQVPDADDNCPITPNPDQADTNANGLGDACDAPFLDGFAYLTQQGVVQSRIDERLRPTKIVAPDGTITFIWSEDASRVDLVVESSGESKTFTLEIDLSDAALLAALDADEAETGQDLSALRAWLAEHPGQVQAVASGEQPPPRLEPTPASSLPPGTVRLASAIIPAAQDQQRDNVVIYIDALGNLFFGAEKTLADFRKQHPERDSWVLTVRSILEVQVNTWSDLWVSQNDNCLNACTNLCNIDCSPRGEGEGACFLDFPQISPCYMYLAQDCAAIEGAVFYHGQTCPGACWITAGGLSDCQETDEETCRLIPERSAGNPTTRFCSTQDCSRPMCSPPAP